MASRKMMMVSLEAQRASMDILIAGLDVCRVLNEKAISLILQFGILKKLVTSFMLKLFYFLFIDVVEFLIRLS